MSDIEILTTREVAERTGWSTQTITRWVVTGRLPYLRKVGGDGRGGFYLFDGALIDRLRTRAEATVPPWSVDTAS